jgi:hypothetical protein
MKYRQQPRQENTRLGEKGIERQEKTPTLGRAPKKGKISFRKSAMNIRQEICKKRRDKNRNGSVRIHKIRSSKGCVTV